MPLLEISNLRASGIATDSNRPQQIDALDLRLDLGHSLSLIGEDRSGTGLIAPLLFKLAKPQSGEILFEGQPLQRSRGASWRRILQAMAWVRDGESSLNPWRSASWVIGEPLLRHTPQLGRRARQEIVRTAAEIAGFDPLLLGAPVAEFDDDHTARAALARGLVTEPKLLVLDHPWPGLDPVARRRIISRVNSLRIDLNIACLLLDDDLHAAADLEGECVVLHDGLETERGDPRELLRSPQERYTRHLVSNTPTLP